MINWKNVAKNFMLYGALVLVMIILLNTRDFLYVMTNESVGWLLVFLIILAWIGYEI